MKAITPEEVHDYICKKDLNLPEKEQTIFEVCYISAPEMAGLRDRMYGEAGIGKKRKVEMRTGTFELDTLKKCLKGWRNLTDNIGNVVEFDPTQIVKMISKILPDARGEIALHVRGEEEED